MRTNTAIGLTMVGAILAGAFAAQAADGPPVRAYPDPGYRLLGSYRGHRCTDYASHETLGLGDQFPDKRQWWANRKAAHDAGTLNGLQILAAYYGVGPGYQFEAGLTLEKIKARFDAWLEPEPGVPTYPELIPAITLAEENAGGQFLDETARHVRETYGIPVLQWWTDPMAPRTSVAADGYVWDSYGWEYPRFRKHVMKFVSLGKPVQCVVWAAHPQWSGYHIRFNTVEEMINSVEQQFQSCMEFNVSTAIFAVAGPHGSNSAWEGSSDPMMVALRNWLRMKRAEMHSFQPGDLPLASANISACSRFPSAGGDPDEPSQYEEDFGGFRWIEDANLMGFLDLKLTSEPEERPGFLLARTRPDRTVTATLTYRFESHFPLTSVTVTLRGAAPAAAQACNTIAISLDGEHWEIQTEQAGVDDIQTATLLADASFLQGTNAFFLQVRMTNDAGKANVPANRLDHLSVQCVHQAPENAAAVLCQEENDILTYQDDFSTTRWKHLGGLTVQHEGYGGPVWVGMKGGHATSVRLVQRVSAPRSLTALKVAANAWANTANLGGHVTLGVAPRDQEIRWQTSTDEEAARQGGVYQGWLALEAPPQELPDLREFDVHLILSSTTAVEGGGQACAAVSGLKIEAR